VPNFSLHRTGSSRFSLLQWRHHWRLLPASELRRSAEDNDMKCQFSTSRGLFLAVEMLCLATAARADSIAFSAATPPTAFYDYALGITFNQTVTLPKFNPALGMLDSIALKLDAVGSTSGWGLNVYNPFEFAVDASGGVSGSLSLSRPDGSKLIFMGHYSSFDNLWSLPRLSTTPVFVSVPDSTGAALLAEPGDLLLFTGVDSITLPVQGFGSPVVYPNPMRIDSVTPQIGYGRVTVTYDFTPIPEPSSFALLFVLAPRSGLPEPKRWAL
jgi:hypothetical protein